MARELVPQNEWGLAVSPANSQDCLADECQYTQRSVRGCFISIHHIHFEREMFSHDATSWEFYNDKLNQMPMVRCQHDRLHQQYSRTDIPPKHIMEIFLRESSLCQSAGVVLRSLTEIEGVLREDAPHRKPRQKWNLLARRDKFLWYRDYWVHEGERIQDSVDSLEVVSGLAAVESLKSQLRQRVYSMADSA
jgi:hypothetical protein